ncbi:unnamed protein product [Amoebophrya sp. A120]|nr:unnamed protein product [Amoebophrya sp. A120]|eukprot:GSA120T00026142001.1
MSATVVLTAAQLLCASKCVEHLVPIASNTLLIDSLSAERKTFWKEGKEHDFFATGTVSSGTTGVSSSTTPSLLQYCLDIVGGAGSSTPANALTASSPLSRTSNWYSFTTGATTPTSNTAQLLNEPQIDSAWTCCKLWQNYLGCRAARCGIQADSFSDLYFDKCFPSETAQQRAVIQALKPEMKPRWHLMPTIFLTGSFVLEFNTLEEKNAFLLLSSGGASSSTSPGTTSSSASNTINSGHFVAINQQFASYIRERFWNKDQFRRTSVLGKQSQTTRHAIFGYETLDFWVQVKPRNTLSGVTPATLVSAEPLARTPFDDEEREYALRPHYKRIDVTEMLQRQTALLLHTAFRLAQQNGRRH